MNKCSNYLEYNIIDTYMRKGRAERSQAIRKSFREIALLVKNLFSKPGAGRAAHGGC